MKIWDYKSKEIDSLSKQVAKDKDIVYTKPEMAKYLLSLVDIRPEDSVMEPCYGKGAFYDQLPCCQKQYCEINLGLDYLEFKEKVDITLSNPPFVPRSLFWEFHRK